MNKNGTVMIGGQAYDAVTGLPVNETQQSQIVPQSTPSMDMVTKRRPHAANNLHTTTQRSATLNRKFTKKPADKRTAISTHHSKHATSVHLDVKPATHPQVRRFAPHPVGATKPAEPTGTPIVVHPHVAKAHAKSQAKAHQQAHAPATPTASVIKKVAVNQAVANAQAPAKTHKSRFWQQRQRVTGIIAATFALVLLGGYVTYLNMPSLSVRVAAAQAGIDASYPDYRPDGYALNGPVTYSDGRVSMAFKANGSDAEFTVNQSKSSWNSEAVLDNYVTPRAGSSYMPYTERGLTIYTYDNNAAWVNGGILYTIEGDAPLSSDQIRRIATSLL